MNAQTDLHFWAISVDFQRFYNDEVCCHCRKYIVFGFFFFNLVFKIHKFLVPLLTLIWAKGSFCLVLVSGSVPLCLKENFLGVSKSWDLSKLLCAVGELLNCLCNTPLVAFKNQYWWVLSQVALAHYGNGYICCWCSMLNN